MHLKVLTPIRLRYEVSKNLSGNEYSYLTSIKSLSANIEFKGVVVDGEFFSQECPQFHIEEKINFLGRIKRNRIVKYQDEEMSLETLAERFHYKVCHLDTRLGWRSKRVAVNIHGFDADILIIYRKDRGL